MIISIKVYISGDFFVITKQVSSVLFLLTFNSFGVGLIINEEIRGGYVVAAIINLSPLPSTLIRYRFGILVGTPTLLGIIGGSEGN